LKRKIINVLLPLPFNQTFQYLCNEDEKIELGDFILVPFKNKIVTGCIWENKSKLKKRLPKKKIRNIEKKLNFSPLNKNNRDFIVWVSDYTMNNLGATLKLCLSIKQIFVKKKIEKIKERFLDLSSDKHLLTKEQLNAKQYIFNKINNKKFSTIVIDGVAGSGKTEVYFEAINKCLIQRKQVLVLLPEISMTTQWFDRFKKRFKIDPLLWHSDIKVSEKIKIWKSVIDGNSNIIVGARSSLFLPFKNLGLIIIDEEHDQSFKQEEGVIYNARDMAVVRAKISNIPIILCSATISIETKLNILEKKYEVVKLKERYGEAGLPEVKIIDLVETPPEKGMWLSEEVHNELKKTIESGNQALFFLNRRGFAPYVFCNSCYKKILCQNCDVGLVYHKKIDNLICHHCGYKSSLENNKKNCKEFEKKCDLFLYGPGVEKIYEEIKKKDKNLNIEILTSDVMQKKGQGETILRKFEREEINVIIGTQILAKGHHFPKLTLVVVVDADFGFIGGDLRAAEKTFQLLTQVSGRSGRSKLPGKVLIQSAMSDNLILKKIKEFDLNGFFLEELNIRKESGLPPFKKLCSLMLVSKNEKKLNDFCRKMKVNIEQSNEFEVLGPAPPFISYVRGKHRKRFIVRCSRNKNIQKFVSIWLKKLQIPFDLKISIDIDPYNFS
jgi:primosomal protein N' (replication factor Y)